MPRHSYKETDTPTQRQTNRQQSHIETDTVTQRTHIETNKNAHDYDHDANDRWVLHEVFAVQQKPFEIQLNKIL